MSTDKSFVSLEAKVCPVCGIKHNHNAGILIDQRMRERFEHETVTGYGLCEEHERMFNDGYIALVEIDPDKSEFMDNGNVGLDGAYRTGRIMYVRRKVYPELVNVPIPASIPLVFIDREGFDRIAGMVTDTSSKEQADPEEHED